MKLFIFLQYQRMMDRFRAIANGCATDKMRFPICRVAAKDGAVQLLDHTINVLALSGGETQIAAPVNIPGKARQFCLRITAMDENTISFVGAAFESDAAGSLAAPAEGETILYTNNGRNASRHARSQGS